MMLAWSCLVLVQFDVFIAVIRKWSSRLLSHFDHWASVSLYCSHGCFGVGCSEPWNHQVHSPVSAASSSDLISNYSPSLVVGEQLITFKSCSSLMSVNKLRTIFWRIYKISSLSSWTNVHACSQPSNNLYARARRAIRMCRQRSYLANIVEAHKPLLTNLQYPVFELERCWTWA